MRNFRLKFVSVYSKVKYILVQALRICTGRTAHRGSRGIALLFLDHGTRRCEGSSSRSDRSLPPGKTRYPFYRRLSGPQGLSGQVRKISPLPGFDPLTVQLVANRYIDFFVCRPLRWPSQQPATRNLCKTRGCNYSFLSS